jgi:hypothetical protein
MTTTPDPTRDRPRNEAPSLADLAAVIAAEFEGDSEHPGEIVTRWQNAEAAARAILAAGWL